jgi:hypothetical protein
VAAKSRTRSRCLDLEFDRQAISEWKSQIGKGLIGKVVRGTNEKLTKACIHGRGDVQRRHQSSSHAGQKAVQPVRKTRNTVAEADKPIEPKESCIGAHLPTGNH